MGGLPRDYNWAPIMIQWTVTMNSAYENLSIGKPLQVSTKSYFLKSMNSADVSDKYVSWWNDDQVQSKLGSVPRGWTRERAVRHVEKFDNRWRFHIGIYDKKNNTLVGFTSIVANPITKITLTNTVIGDKAFWRVGVVKELSAWAIPFAFENLGMEKIKAEIKGENLGSIAVCDYLGFRKEGVLRSELPTKTGERLDVHIYALLKSEWKRLKNVE